MNQRVTVPLVEVLRGSLVEQLHRGVVAVVDAAGRLRGSAGDPAAVVSYWRSGAKPFQAMPTVYSGAAARWGLTPEDLALIAGSHSGEPVHVEAVAALLERIHRGVEDLACGVHPPLDPDAAGALLRAGSEPSVLHNNCSANHAGVLALAEELGAGTTGYESPDHPAQREILENVARFTGLSTEAITVGVDGCGVPSFGISVHHMALAFARLAAPDGEVAEPYASAAGAVRDAMLAHPHLVGGTARLDTELMGVGAGRLVAKGGAGGVQCVGIAGGLGVALKLEDGATGPSPARPGSVATVEVLRRLGALDDDQVARLDSHARPVLRTLTGREVGSARAAFTLDGTGASAAGRA